MSGLSCVSCGETYPLNEPVWKCRCGGLLDVDFSPVFPLDEIGAREPGMWRYREALPVERDENVVSFGEGYTPLLAIDIGGREVYLKQDHLFPTGSFKDRGASVLVSKLKEIGIKKIVEDSSGNAGAAIAAYAARAGIECEIYVPADAPGGKLDQIRRYGAVAREIPGTREDVAAAALDAAGDVYYASHVWNPFFLQGTKTFAYEVCEQLGWKAPDTVVLPVGNGTLLLGAWIGFGDLLAAGIIAKRPGIVAVQSARCAPLFRAYEEGSPEIPDFTPGTTIAGGIAVARPRRFRQILDAVEKSGGGFICVEEGEILAAMEDMGRRGVFIEPTSAAAVAGLKKHLRDASPDEVVVSALTGHGLKMGDSRRFRDEG